MGRSTVREHTSHDHVGMRERPPNYEHHHQYFLPGVHRTAPWAAPEDSMQETVAQGRVQSRRGNYQIGAQTKSRGTTREVHSARQRAESYDRAADEPVVAIMTMRANQCPQVHQTVYRQRRKHSSEPVCKTCRPCG